MALFIRPQIPTLISSSHADPEILYPQLVHDTDQSRNPEKYTAPAVKETPVHFAVWRSWAHSLEKDCRVTFILYDVLCFDWTHRSLPITRWPVPGAYAERMNGFAAAAAERVATPDKCI